jgi:hypothetical protein
MASPGHRFVAGHNSKTDHELELRSKRMKDLWENTPEKFDDREVWSTGLTKETDDRLNWYSKRISASFTPEKREYYRELGHAQERNLIRGFGPDHANWKGGVADLQQRTRAALVPVWGRPIMKRDDWTCQVCQKKLSGDAAVHHDQERFAPIMHRFVAGRNVREMTWEAVGELVWEIVQYHLDNNVHGITLCKPCHQDIHVIDPDVD